MIRAILLLAIYLISAAAPAQHIQITTTNGKRVDAASLSIANGSATLTDTAGREARLPLDAISRRRPRR